jgi:hypothetical protein
VSIHSYTLHLQRLLGSVLLSITSYLKDAAFSLCRPALFAALFAALFGHQEQRDKRDYGDDEPDGKF